ncbi:RraA family protein [Neobacillus sp. NPDC093182]|uniref:RraA family protein n=1 Tax=Neobacillus sp. NPDC093182 TaxID=3364297 RepID=UPI0037FC12E8
MSTLPQLLSDHIIERAEKLNTTLLSDAMGGTGDMDYRINRVAKGMKVVGTATKLSLKPSDNVSLHDAIYAAKEDYVLVIDGKGETSRAYLGELLTRAAIAIGLKGIVIDGAVRDREELEALGFPVFVKVFVPNGPLKLGGGEINVTITCGNVTVNPGDLVVGDADGVTIVPREQIEEVFSKAEKKLEYEKNRILESTFYEEKRKRGET